MHHCILHLGSNLGDSKINLDCARDLIQKKCGQIYRASSLYQTEPWGVEIQEVFLNQAIWIISDLSVEEILSTIQSIEVAMGRQNHERWGPRLIDIDIMFYDQQIIENDQLIIPHPQLTNRNFVLVPLAELCPGWVHPESTKTIVSLAKESKDLKKVSLKNNG